MSDQADGLRQLVRGKTAATASATATLRPRSDRPAAPGRARSLVLTSGKGGVGTSNLALNLAIALGERGRRVVLVDADLGLANIDLLCGLAPPADLGDVLSEGRPLAEAIVEGPAGIRIVAGAHGSRTWVEALGDAPGRLLEELAGLEMEADHLIVDAGSGLGPGIATLAASADEVAVVTTPEPPSMADAHAAIRRLGRPGPAPSLGVIVSQARSSAEAAAVLREVAASSRQFLGLVVAGLGSVRSDPHVPLAVRSRRPYVTAYPGASASRDVRRLARGLALREAGPARGGRPGFFAALAARWGFD